MVRRFQRRVIFYWLTLQTLLPAYLSAYGVDFHQCERICFASAQIISALCKVDRL
jgi:hypothetical protein